MSSDSEEEIAAAAIIILACEGKKETQKKEYGTKSWLRKRKQFGVYDALLREFLLEEEANYFNFLRMTPVINCVQQNYLFFTP